MSLKVLFILSGNLSTTPRALKSIIETKKIFSIDIIAINRNNTWKRIDNLLVLENKLNYKAISMLRKPFFYWFVNSIKHKLNTFFYCTKKKKLKITSFASSKTCVFLDKELKNIRKKYDLIVAHSYSSFFPAYKYSQKLNIPLILDIEDYHPGEQISDNDKNEKQRREFLMKSILPKAAFITYASTLIGEYTLKLIPDFPKERTMLINNCFSESEFQFKENNSEKVKFVWFSQNIAKGRGLEFIVPALEKFKNQIELTLIGNLYTDFYENFLEKYSDFIKIEKPLSQKELNLKLSEFDIGLAVELNNSDFNRQICLTNKIWAYLQSGLYILATDTPAQVKFIEEHKNIGFVTKQNNDSFENSIKKIINDIQSIRTQKFERFEYSKQHSWENEREKLVQIWNNTII